MAEKSFKTMVRTSSLPEVIYQYNNGIFLPFIPPGNKTRKQSLNRNVANEIAGPNRPLMDARIWR